MEMQRLFWPHSSSTMQRRQQFYTLVRLLSVLVVYSYLAFVWLLPLGLHCLLGETSPVEVHWWHWIMFVVLLLLPAVFILCVFSISRGTAAIQGSTSN